MGKPSSNICIYIVSYLPKIAFIIVLINF